MGAVATCTASAEGSIRGGEQLAKAPTSLPSRTKLIARDTMSSLILVGRRLSYLKINPRSIAASGRQSKKNSACHARDCCDVQAGVPAEHCKVPDGCHARKSFQGVCPQGALHRVTVANSMLPPPADRAESPTNTWSLQRLLHAMQLTAGVLIRVIGTDLLICKHYC